MAFGVGSANQDSFGYNKAASPARKSFGGETPDGAVLTDGLSRGLDAMNDPAFDKKQSMTSQFAQAVDPSADASKSLMQRINPGTDYKATMPTGQVSFDSNKAITTGAQAKDKVDASQDSVKENMKKFVEDFDKASVQLAQAIYDVAGPEDGTRALDALGAFDSAPGKGNAIVTAASQGVFGSTAFNLIAIAVAVKDEGKKMSEQEVKAILAEARDKLVLDNKNQQEQELEQVISTPAPGQSDKKKFEWDKATIDDLKTLAAGDPTSQPEFMQLERQWKFLEELQDGFKQNQRDYAKSNVAEKVVAHGGEGRLIVDALPTIQAERHQKVAQEFDATSITLAGQGVNSYKITSVTGAQATTYAAAMQNTSEIAQTLSNDERTRAIYQVAPPKDALNKIAVNLFG